MKKITCLIAFLQLALTSFAQQKSLGSDSIDVISYSIHIDTVDITTQQLYGYTNIDLQPKVNSLHFVPLDLLALNVDSIFVNSVKVTTFSYNDTLLKIECPTPLAGVDTAHLQIFYHGQPVMDPSTWGGFYFSSPYAYNLGVGFESNPHNFGRVWFPCIDDFVDKAFYEFHIATDTNQMAVCGGLLMDTTHLVAENKILWHWAIAESIPTYIASMAVGPYICVADTFTGLLGEIPINIYVAQSIASKVPGSFGNLPLILAAFEDRFGPYLWERVGYVGVPFNAGAMEHAENIAYPNLAITGNLSYESLTAHELSHHWFGNLVTCSTAEEMWLNEGWAVFCEFIYTESLQGVDAMNIYIRSKHADVLKKAHYDDGGFYPVGNVPTEITYGTTVYDKGGLVVHTLRNYMGDDLFFPAVKLYLDSLKFKNADIATMRDIFAESSGINLNDFFDAWVYREGFPHFDVDSFSVSGSGPYTVTTYLRQKLYGTTQFANSNRVELTFLDSAWNSFTVTAEFSGQTGTDVFTVPFSPTGVIIDLEEKTADAIISYNQKIKVPGTYSFPLAYCSVSIVNNSDSLLLRAEHHKVAPDPVLSNPDIYRISQNRYWRISGIIPPETSFTALFDYSRLTSTSTGILDFDLMPTTASYDSLVLLYRPNSAGDWAITPFMIYGNSTSGKIKATNALPGEYTLGIGKPFQAGSIDQAAPCLLKAYPNPSQDVFLIEVSKAKGGNIIICDAAGKNVFDQKIMDNNATLQWKPTGASGQYFVSVYDASKTKLTGTSLTYTKQ